jgi:predicted phosphodiesterase
MKVLIVADVHYDFWCEAGRDPFAALTAADWAGVEAVIIAGDLTNKPRVRWKYAIRHIARYITPDRIHIIPGNHDYYDFQIDRDDRLAEIATSEGAHLAQKTEILIRGTRFLCCTLWTDFGLNGDVAGSQAIARARMNDYRYIRNAGAGYRRILPSDTALIHTDHRAWLEERLSRPHRGQTIVVTHHCPLPGLVSKRADALAPVYASDLSDVIERYQPSGWFFGHTHHRDEVVIGQTRIKNVSIGYPDDVQTGTEPRILGRGLIDPENP